jgi:hypothetical protein
MCVYYMESSPLILQTGTMDDYAEEYAEFIRIELIDAGARTHELPEMIAQLVAEDLPYEKIEARIAELGWGETDDEFSDTDDLSTTIDT